MKEAHQDDGHVVAPQPAHGGVGCQAPGHELLADELGLHPGSHLADDKVGHFLFGKKKF